VIATSTPLRKARPLQHVEVAHKPLFQCESLAALAQAAEPATQAAGLCHFNW
jgi:hypothetical protein